MFFSELGGDWPLHRCLSGLVETHGKDFIERGMALQIKKHTASNLKSPIERRYEDVVKGQYANRQKQGTAWIKRANAAEGKSMEDSAILREVERKVDLFGKFGLSPTSAIAVAFMAKLAKGDHGQLTVHIGGLQDTSVESYTAFAPTKLLDELRLQRGDLVSISLISRSVGPGKWVWFVQRLSFLVN